MAAPGTLQKFVDVGRKIVCVGRNYAEHAVELGNAVPTEPLIFLKPTSAYLQDGGSIEFPPGCGDMHHEVELGIVIGQRASRVREDDVMSLVAGYALALDMTARDLQAAAKKKGQPWSLAKGFDTSCPVSGFISKSDLPEPGATRLWCRVNGEMKQDGNTCDMIFSIPRLVSFISGFMTLEPGDLVLTGTPAGVGPVKPGDVIEAGLNDVTRLKVYVA